MHFVRTPFLVQFPGLPKPSTGICEVRGPSPLRLLPLLLPLLLLFCCLGCCRATGFVAQALHRDT
jgi:hypothetical protein